jgi:type II secretory pathway pseudopilin PulG
VEVTVALAISIISVVITVLNFAQSRKDKSNKDVQEEQKQFSKHDLIEYRLDKIEKQLEKILNKLDTFDKEIDEKIRIAMKHHIAEFHNKEK